MSGASFSFPLLKPSEIVNCVNELGIPLTLAQLQDPAEEVIRPALEKLCELLKGCARSELQQMNFAGLSAFAYPELHDESIVEMGLLKEQLDLCYRTGMFDVTLPDLVTPERVRTRRIFSALINFAKFREDKLEHFSQYTAHTQQLLEQRDMLDSKVEELETRAASMGREHARVEPQIAAVQAEAEQAKAQVNQLAGVQTSLRVEVKEEKAASQAVADKLAEVNAQIAVVQSEAAKVRAQIVHEPEKLKQALKDMTAQMHQGRNLTNAQSSKLKALQAKLSNYGRVEDKITARTELMQSALGEANNVAKLRRSVADQHAQASALEAVVSELGAQEEQLKENMSNAQEKLFQLQRSFESKRVTATAALEQVQAEKDQLERMLSSQRAQAEQAENCLALKKQQLAAQSAEHQRTMSQLRGQYSKLQQVVGEYHTKLADVIHQATTA